MKSQGDYFSSTNRSSCESLIKRINYSKDYDRNKIKFVAPQDFSIETNRFETLKFFNDILEYIEKNQENNDNKMIYIDSHKVKRVTESTLMYLFAIISDVKCTNYDIGGNHPEDRTIKQMYKMCGFNQLLRNEEYYFNNDKNGNMLLIRGKDVKTSSAKIVCEFLNQKVGMKTTQFYGAFIEMMTNTVQHAYYDFEERKLERKWQVFVRYLDDQIKFVFLDTGKGIPATVKKNKKERLLEVFKPILKFVGEEDILKSAFDGQFRTRTEDANRGKGLPQIYNLFKSDNIDDVFVYSGKSSCIIKKDMDDEYFADTDEFYGTLYEFNIRGV